MQYAVDKQSQVPTIHTLRNLLRVLFPFPLLLVLAKLGKKTPGALCQIASLKREILYIS